MIINWLLYSLLVGAILGFAGLAFEYGARALRFPTRWVWIAVMALSTVFSALKLTKGLLAHRENSAAVEEVAVPAANSAIDSDSVPQQVWAAREASRVRPWSVAQRSSVPRIVTEVLNRTGGLPAPIGVHDKSFRSFDSPLLVACGVLTLLGMITLAVTFARLSGVAFALDHGVVEGVPVLLSRNIGPALLGIVRFRVVLPRWVTEMPSADVRTILAHEHEHALAADPALTLGALVMVALQPWNPAMWLTLSRLRLATEADCDARVLGADGDVRSYGHLLVNVYQRSQPGLSPLTSFVTRTSQLEARIRRMVKVAPPSFSPKTIGAFAAALLLCILAYSLEVTAQPTAQFDGLVEEAMADEQAAATVQLPAKPKYEAPANQGTYLPNIESAKRLAAAERRKRLTPGVADRELASMMARLDMWDGSKRNQFKNTAASDSVRVDSGHRARKNPAASKNLSDTLHYDGRN